MNTFPFLSESCFFSEGKEGILKPSPPQAHHSWGMPQGEKGRFYLYGLVYAKHTPLVLIWLGIKFPTHIWSKVLITAKGLNIAFKSDPRLWKLSPVQYCHRGVHYPIQYMAILYTYMTWTKIVQHNHKEWLSGESAFE